MRFNKLDLNLLVALDALLTEESVSNAAEKIHLSQSAMSAALRRLREFFNDELFVVVGRRMRPTPLALELAVPVRRVLTDIQAEVIQREPFDPMTTERSFSIAASDYLIRVFLSGIAEKLQREAPNLRLDIWPLTGSNTLAKFAAAEIDLIISLDQNLTPDLPKADLYSEDFVVIAWDQNTEIHGPLTRDDYERLGHVVVRLGSYRMAPIDEVFISELGVNRRAEVIVGAFDHAPDFVVNTQRLATIQRRLARHFAATMPIRIHEIPFETPEVKIGMQWHRHNTADPAHHWLRDSIERHIGAMP